MSQTTGERPAEPAGTEAEHVDVLIIGAGLSGIGAAAQLTRMRPESSYAILEGRTAMGGTWDLFRYPGIRSDSDMFTLGYRFKPWTDDKALADGPSILAYVEETAREYGVDRHIRYDHRVVAAAWDSDSARWTVTATHAGEEVRLTCRLLWSCGGYYDYDHPYDAQLPGLADFEGRVVHPQFWPEDLDYADKRVVVVGSGATAVTLVPALAERAAHVTMLQRSPTYIVSMPRVDKIAGGVRRVLPEKAAYVVNRWKNIGTASGIYALSRRRPDLLRGLIRKGTISALPEGYDVDTHFRPAYDPWDQRLCLVPDGDLFEAISQGRAEVVTDTIDTFTPTGVRLTSGRELEADIVVTATGLQVRFLGGARLLVDGQEVKLPETMAYKAMMLSGVPNFLFTVGYTNASWTLKADLVAEYACRLLDHLDAEGYRAATPRRDPTVGERPIMDFEAGYVLRALVDLPSGGDREPWMLRQNYLHDVRVIRRGELEDGALEFSR
ncbi:flavin-containing monooxygenase [Nocardioides sp.]|uniref:flavin-containing monooxygenase n=1 Tax=Nocardioides sp. TaxID=35761 RepID=UPI00352950F9